MLMRLLRAAFAVLVALLFVGLPTLTLASPATASPPLVEVGLAPDVAQTHAQMSGYTDTSPDAFAGEIANDELRSSTVSADPAYPLRE